MLIAEELGCPLFVIRMAKAIPADPMYAQVTATCCAQPIPAQFVPMCHGH
jgi:hypothetical protein